MQKRTGIILILLFLLIGKNKAQSGSPPFDQQLLQSFISATKPANKESVNTFFKEGKWSLLVFLSPECPLSKNYSIVLQKIATDFKNSLQIVGIIPGSTFKRKEVKQFADKYGIEFPLLIDKTMNSVTVVDATTTPEVVLMDSKANLIYRGAIDDWAVDLGKKKNKASIEYLRLAIEQSISGMPVRTKMVQPVGCLINNF